MKAKELAALLLQTPESEVYFETLQFDSYGDSYNQTHKVRGLGESTPDGIFIEHDYLGMREHVKTPTNKPIIGSARIKLDSFVHDHLPSDCNYSSGPSDLDTGSFWEELFREGQYYSYVSNGDSVIFEHSTKVSNSLGYDYGDRTVYSAEDVEYVEVLTELDDLWNETWIKMSFEEAYEYFTKDIQTQEDEG